MTRVSKNRPYLFSHPMPLLIVLSGPSGAGKDVVLARLKELKPPLRYITTVTTRPMRPTECNGRDYHFVSAEKFQDMLQRNELLEWARVYEHWYGVPRQPVKASLEEGFDTVVKVDVQGAATLKKLVPEAVYIFLTAPTIEELKKRLQQRHTESAEEFARRLNAAEGELTCLPVFDYLVFSRWEELDRAAAEIQAIINAEKCRVNPRKITL